MAAPGPAGKSQSEDNPYRALEPTPIRPATTPAASVASPPVAASAEESAPEALNAANESIPLRRPIIKTAPHTGFFAPEKHGIDKGVLGGLLMMAIAGVWFVVGWKAGRIFFYPPNPVCDRLVRIPQRTSNRQPRRKEERKWMTCLPG